MDLFTKFVTKKFDDLKTLFIRKHEQYGTEDPLANFRCGAALVKGAAPTNNDMYKELLAYVRKHIAFLMTHDLYDKKVGESLQDVAVYMVIALYLHEKDEEPAETLSNIYLEKIKYENLCQELKREIAAKDSIIQKQIIMLSEPKEVCCDEYNEELCKDCKYKVECMEDCKDKKENMEDCNEN